MNTVSSTPVTMSIVSEISPTSGRNPSKLERATTSSTSATSVTIVFRFMCSGVVFVNDTMPENVLLHLRP